MKKTIAILTAAVMLLVLSGCGKQRQENSETGIQNPAITEETEETAVPEATQAADATTEAEAAKGEPQATEQPFLVQITEDDPSIAYVLVRMQNSAGLLPLPVEGEYTRTIRQTAGDGSEMINVLHLTPNGFWMEEANCEGHDCIEEGEVTLENREERVLWNMIICLPHQLMAELVTREEVLAMLGY